MTIGSITFAVLLACVMRSMQLGSYENMIKNAAQFYTGYIQIHKNGYWDEQIIDNAFAIDDQLMPNVASTKGVELVVPRVESFALASFETQTRGALVMGVDPEKEAALTKAKDKMVDGEYLDPDDKSVLVSQGLAEYLKIQVGDSVVLLGQGYHGANAAGIYPVKGIVKFPNPRQNAQLIYLPLKEAQWFYALEENQLTSLSLVIDKARNTNRIVADISANTDTELLEVMGWEVLLPDLVQGIELDNISGKMMLWILYAVIGFGMFGTFLMMTAERMYEFGVMMAVGMRRYVMQWTVFLEMGLLATIGVLVGIGISFPILTYYYFNPIYITGDAVAAFELAGVEAVYMFSLQPSLFYNQAWAIFFMALILGFYPLIVIQKLSPVGAMREGL